MTEAPQPASMLQKRTSPVRADSDTAAAGAAHVQCPLPAATSGTSEACGRSAELLLQVLPLKSEQIETPQLHQAKWWWQASIFHAEGKHFGGNGKAQLAQLKLYPEQKHEEFDAVHTPLVWTPLVDTDGLKFRVQEDRAQDISRILTSQRYVYRSKLKWYILHPEQIETLQLHQASGGGEPVSSLWMECASWATVTTAAFKLRGKPSARRGAFLCNCVDPKLRQASRKARPKNQGKPA